MHGVIRRGRKDRLRRVRDDMETLLRHADASRNIRAIFAAMNTLVALVALLAGCIILPAQDPVEHRMTDVRALFKPNAGGFDTVFAASFRAKVTDAQLLGGLQQIQMIAGPPVSHRIVKRTTQWTARAEIITSNAYSIPVTISVEEQPPHLINGLFMRPPIKVTTSKEENVEDLASLSGRTSLAVVNLTTDRVVMEHNPKARHPIGSTFKLYILGACAQQVVEKKRNWTDIVPLVDSLKSLPSGQLQDWPNGAPVTLHTLATLMISISDNTATDLLLHTVGRANVEAYQRVMGHEHPEWNVPFLSTREAFLKKYDSKHLGLLDSLVLTDAPALIDSVEWFASTMDLVRAMKALKNLSDTQPRARELMDILTVNGGLSFNRDVWKTVAYKGGSEPGVLNFTFLLQHRNGTWYAVSASWTNEKEDVDLGRFASVVESIVKKLEE
jgi:hypothetical protein